MGIYIRNIGTYINRNNILEETRSIREKISHTKHQVSLIVESINKFNGTKDILTGKAWDASREYSESVLLPVLRMYIECLTLEYDANGKYGAAADRLPKFEKLDEDVIITTKEKYERRLDREYNREYPRNSVINFYEKKIARCEKLLDIIYEFCDETSGIFDEVKSRQDYLRRLHYYLKMINVDKATGEMLLPAGSVNIQYAKAEIARYYANIKRKELEERTKELEEIYKLKGAKAVIQNILTKPVEERLNTDIEKLENSRITGILIESDEDYVGLLSTVISYCYDYDRTMEISQGYFDVVNVVYKKNDRADKILAELEGVGLVLDCQSKSIDTENEKISAYRRNWIQLYQVFLKLSEYDDEIVTSKRYARKGDSSVMQVKGEHKISVVRKEDDLVINFALYAGDNGGVTSFYEDQREVNITISMALRGGTGDEKTKEISADYIYYWHNLDKTVPENISEHMADYSIAMVTGNFIPWLSNTITTANMFNNIYNDVNETNKGMFTEYKNIGDIGKTVDVFNLFYIASSVREEGKSERCEYRIYPSYKVDTGEIEMTKECIENFNTNFSKGGKFEIFARSIGYDENSPITEDDFIGNISKIDDIMDKWYKVAVQRGKDIKEATRRLTK